MQQKDSLDKKDDECHDDSQSNSSGEDGDDVDKFKICVRKKTKTNDPN